MCEDEEKAKIKQKLLFKKKNFLLLFTTEHLLHDETKLICWKKSLAFMSLGSNKNSIGVCDSVFSKELLSVSLSNYYRTCPI